MRRVIIYSPDIYARIATALLTFHRVQYWITYFGWAISIIFHQVYLRLPDSLLYKLYSYFSSAGGRSRSIGIDLLSSPGVVVQSARTLAHTHSHTTLFFSFPLADRAIGRALPRIMAKRLDKHELIVALLLERARIPKFYSRFIVRCDRRVSRSAPLSQRENFIYS